VFNPSDNHHYTNEQAKICVGLAQNITCLYQLPIHVIRLDERTNNIFILAGENLGISVFKDGNWRFEQ
jgi:hypothetical protein